MQPSAHLKKKSQAEILKQRISSELKKELAIIESELAENLQPRYDLVREVAGHILFGGGKRLRPLLMILGARMCGYNGQREHTLATSFEYLHAATLLHDDLIDQGAVRRGNPAAHITYGNETAVLTGDFLLARALTVSAMTENLAVVRTIVNITEQMSQGEIDQLDNKGQVEITEPQYLDIIRCKTAVLFQGACRVGALIAGASDSHIEALSIYGLNLGLAFQMTDDLLDYTADTSQLGKGIGADLKEGKLTLPVIKALENASREEREEMIAIIANPKFSDSEFKRLVTLLHGLGGIEYTYGQAERLISFAKAAIDSFPLSTEKRVLNDIADYALVRNQ